MNPPCIRGLKRFEKKGCPQMEWNGREGCPAWIDIQLPIQGGKEQLKIKECVDMYQVRLQYSTNALLEGNQQAIESFRNGMVYPAQDGQCYPKPDPATAELICKLNNRFNVSSSSLLQSEEVKCISK